MENDALAFWHANLGCFMSDALPEKSGKASVPTWLGKDDPASIANGKGVRVANHGIGAKIPLFYIVTPEHAWVYGKVALESTPRVTYSVNGPMESNKALTRWLIEDATTPFMVGVIADASPNSSFRISHHQTKSYYCEAGGGFSFNLEHVRSDLALLQGKPWRDVASLIYTYETFRQTQPGSQARESVKKKLMPLLKKMPEMQALLQRLHVKPGSGEMEILRWAMNLLGPTQMQDSESERLATA